jgi:hypothetical protein
MPFRAAQFQGLKDERRDVHVTCLAAVGDLLHLHEAVAGGVPRLVGFGLLLELTLEIGLALLELALRTRRLSGLAMQRPRHEHEGKDADG